MNLKNQKKYLLFLVLGGFLLVINACDEESRSVEESLVGKWKPEGFDSALSSLGSSSSSSSSSGYGDVIAFEFNYPYMEFNPDHTYNSAYAGIDFMDSLLIFGNIVHKGTWEYSRGSKKLLLEYKLYEADNPENSTIRHNEYQVVLTSKSRLVLRSVISYNDCLVTDPYLTAGSADFSYLRIE